MITVVATEVLAPLAAESSPPEPATTIPAATALPVLAAMWRTAAVAGAPLAGALRAAARAMRQAAEVRRATEVALAGPRATTRLVVAMPAVAVVFGALLGYDTIGVLIGTPIGWACAVAF